jgi:hypothetical protein
MTAVDMAGQLQHNIGVLCGLADCVGCMCQQNDGHPCRSIAHSLINIHPTMPYIIDTGKPECALFVLYRHPLVLEQRHPGE